MSNPESVELTAVGTPRVLRATQGRLVAGVAQGLAHHLGWPVWVVRLLFVVLAFAGGAGVVLYAAYWAVIPLAPDSPSADTNTEARVRQRDLGGLLALAALLVGALLLLPLAGVDVGGSLIVPLALAGVGAALVWRQSDDSQRNRWRSSAAGAATGAARTTARAGWWRGVVGAGLVLAGLVALLAGRAGVGDALRGLASGAVLLLGVGVVAFPWLYRQGRELSDERRARIREQERAEIAAHVHDSVLQTLTLIQQNIDDPATVARLARTEERSLRSWLYAPVGDPDRTLAAAVQREAADIEATYGATLEVVTVGDAALDLSLAALVAACREAMVNSAKHGGGTASIYVEVSDETAEIFVRDRGPGFDTTAVPPDRLGIEQSIVGRMERNGGNAQVRSRAGVQGTEVHLRMPRSPQVPDAATTGES
ncbi:MAG: PspC domain-containing protein [Actinomycetes bacterium]